jgi:hypothetical protein
VAAWDDISTAGTSDAVELGKRPAIRTTIQENFTIAANWAETENSDVAKLLKKHGRIINNLTLIIPRPGTSLLR